MEGAYHLARRGSNKVLLLHGWSRLRRQLYKGTYTHTVHEKQHALVIVSLCLPLDVDMSSVNYVWHCSTYIISTTLPVSV